MSEDRRTRHLKRGNSNLPATPEAAAHATEGAIRAREKRKVDDAKFDSDAEMDPSTVIRKLFTASGKAALRLYEKYNTTGRGGDKFLIDASREARQLADRLFEIIQLEGSMARADDLLAEISDRVESLAPRLAESAQPIVTAPVRSSGVLDATGDVRG
jgi:hypothetical protein